MVLRWGPFELDLCGGSHGTIDRCLSAHDIIATRLATDGRSVLAGPDALEDLRDRRLRVSRVTRPERLKKYLNELHLSPRVDHDFAEQQRLYRDIAAGVPVPGWSANGLSWRQAVLGEQG